jgi:hypothetical protein
MLLNGFLLNLISELPNMFLSKMSFLDSVEHDPKQLSMLIYFGMDEISKWSKVNRYNLYTESINSEMDSWHAIGKHLLQKYDDKFEHMNFQIKSLIS